MLASKSCVGKMKSPPVLLMHGLILSSDMFLDAGVSNGLAYLLADACYDLWVGNQRGNYYGRRHLTLNPDKDLEFWRFSVDEIGYYDVPAIIDYVLNFTRSQQLSYIGFSQGCGSLFIMCSEKAGYCDKINLVIGLAPATRHYNSRSFLFRNFPLLVLKSYPLLLSFNITEMLTRFTFCKDFNDHMLSKGVSKTCSELFSLIDLPHPESVDQKTKRAISNHFPAGTSTQNFARYGQSIISKEFVKFDYGASKNLAVYGRPDPPRYNLSMMTAPFVGFYGKNDGIVDRRDFKWAVGQFPNVVEAKPIADPLWNHFDFAYSKHIKQLLFPYINQYLSVYSNEYKYLNSA